MHIIIRSAHHDLNNTMYKEALAYSDSKIYSYMSRTACKLLSMIVFSCFGTSKQQQECYTEEGKILWKLHASTIIIQLLSMIVFPF